MAYFGIDIGCTSIKYGVVDFTEGTQVSGFDTVFISQNERTEKYLDALNSLLKDTAAYQAVGIGFPSIVQRDQIMNLSIAWGDIWQAIAPIVRTQDTGCYALNDADAAGFAEVYRQGAENLRKGVCIIITLGTGIGSAIFINGRLLPNSELGLLEMHGMAAEQYAAASVKTSLELSMEVWAARLQEYLTMVETLFYPDTLILAGGISNDFESFKSLLTTRAVLQPAYYRKQAGVIGAALYADIQTRQLELP
jgi:polyphosphate glucokinase